MTILPTQQAQKPHGVACYIHTRRADRYPIGASMLGEGHLRGSEPETTYFEINIPYCRTNDASAL